MSNVNIIIFLDKGGFFNPLDSKYNKKNLYILIDNFNKQVYNIIL